MRGCMSLARDAGDDIKLRRIFKKHFEQTGKGECGDD